MAAVRRARHDFPMDKTISSFAATLLPVLLGLGLIELYISRGVSITVVAAAIFALAMLMVVIAALNDIAAMRRPRRKRVRIPR